MAKVRFSASGYGTKTYRFKTAHEAQAFIAQDAADVADEYGGRMTAYGDAETVVTARDGDEIARWELLG